MFIFYLSAVGHLLGTMIDMLSNISWRIHILFILCFIISHFTQGYFCVCAFIFVCSQGKFQANGKWWPSMETRWGPRIRNKCLNESRLWGKVEGLINLDEVSFSAIRTSNYFTGRENRYHTDHPFHHTLLFVYLNQSNRTLPQELAKVFFFFILHYEHLVIQYLTIVYLLSQTEKKLSVRIRFSNAMPPFTFCSSVLTIFASHPRYKQWKLKFPSKILCCHFIFCHQTWSHLAFTA